MARKTDTEREKERVGETRLVLGLVGTDFSQKGSLPSLRPDLCRPGHISGERPRRSETYLVWLHPRGLANKIIKPFECEIVWFMAPTAKVIQQRGARRIQWFIGRADRRRVKRNMRHGEGGNLDAPGSSFPFSLIRTLEENSQLMAPLASCNMSSSGK